MGLWEQHLTGSQETGFPFLAQLPQQLAGLRHGIYLLDLDFCGWVVKEPEWSLLSIKCDTREEAGLENTTCSPSLPSDPLCTWTSDCREVVTIWFNPEFPHPLWPKNSLTCFLFPSFLPFSFFLFIYCLLIRCRTSILRNSLWGMQVLNEPSLGCFLCLFLLYIWNLDLLKCYSTGTTIYYFYYCLIII